MSSRGRFSYCLAAAHADSRLPNFDRYIVYVHRQPKRWQFCDKGVWKAVGPEQQRGLGKIGCQHGLRAVLCTTRLKHEESSRVVTLLFPTARSPAHHSGRSSQQEAHLRLAPPVPKLSISGMVMLPHKKQFIGSLLDRSAGALAVQPDGMSQLCSMDDQFLQVGEVHTVPPRLRQTLFFRDRRLCVLSASRELERARC